MKIIIHPKAKIDLLEGFSFYQDVSPGLGHHFLTSIHEDIDRLNTLAGIHAREYGFQRIISKKFPFAIFYELEDELVNVFAVIDWRKDPAWIKDRLSQ